MPIVVVSFWHSAADHWLSAAMKQILLADAAIRPREQLPFRLAAGGGKGGSVLQGLPKAARRMQESAFLLRQINKEPSLPV
ncbi:hypothetical protein [Hoeflea sp.]|uniref:hypothetical protein n=1 Tax=Hoeflea sp. TaxID=1940281 RepID=UPI003747C9FF